jgi:hypothetical protein
VTLTRRRPIKAKPRSKGNRGELQVIDIYKAHGWPARRNWQSGGQGGADIIGGPPGTSTEVKWQERLNIWKALEQCERAAKPTDLPILAFKRNGSGWYGAVPLDELLALLKAAQS